MEGDGERLSKKGAVSPVVHDNFLRNFSRTLVSVELQTDMRRSRAQTASARRVILKASITSVILLTIAFIITYSVLLTYISNRVPLMRHHDDHGEKSKSGKRTKLTYRPYDVFGRGHVVKVTTDTVVKWQVDQYEDVFSEKPKCLSGRKIIILITSSPENYDRRKAIRDTWCGSVNVTLSTQLWQCIFLIGQSTHRPSNILIESEISKYHDVLIGSYTDSYRNLTIKTMHGLLWASQECPSDFVLKTDDDVYVNTQLLVRLVTRNTPLKDMYIGSVTQSVNKLRVIRDWRSKWYVKEEEYAPSHYPPYAVGMGYLLSLDVIHRMVNSSKYLAPFANEDAYIGVLADRLGVEPFKSGRFTLTGSGLRTCNFVYLVVIHNVLAADQYSHFQTNQEANRQCVHPGGAEDLSWL